MQTFSLLRFLVFFMTMAEVARLQQCAPRCPNITVTGKHYLLHQHPFPVVIEGGLPHPSNRFDWKAFSPWQPIPSSAAHTHSHSHMVSLATVVLGADRMIWSAERTRLEWWGDEASTGKCKGGGAAVNHWSMVARDQTLDLNIFFTVHKCEL